MVDKDPDNDEYKFVESDFQEHKPLDESYENLEKSSAYEGSMSNKKNVIRNASIAAAIIVLVFLIYGFFSSKSKPKAVPPVQPSVSPVPALPKPVASPVPVPAVAPVIEEVDAELKQKVAVIESNQQSVSSQVSSVSQEMGTVTSSVKNLTEEMSKLNLTLTSLSNQVESQAREIQILMKRLRSMRIQSMPRQDIIYYIKAIIPGRAWLIAPNGSTLSIREGINLNGYGIVKLIDSIQGRVLTSSGRVITFSQDDS